MSGKIANRRNGRSASLSTVPVLTVKLRARAAYRNVVVATDFSDPSRYALEAAAGWFDKQPLTVFNAYHVPCDILVVREEKSALKAPL